jgi:hypothetical protein
MIRIRSLLNSNNLARNSGGNHSLDNVTNDQQLQLVDQAALDDGVGTGITLLLRLSVGRGEIHRAPRTANRTAPQGGATPYQG